ncbi:MAG: hypothetical protein ACTHOL_04025, partial [Luteibacter jiangsuensis]
MRRSLLTMLLLMPFATAGQAAPVISDAAPPLLGASADGQQDVSGLLPGRDEQGLSLSASDRPDQAR